MASHNLALPGRQLRLRVEAKKPTVHQKVADKNRSKGAGAPNKPALDRLYTDTTYKPSRFANNLSLARHPGRCGLITTENIGPAETLLVSEPLVFLTAEQGAQLRPRDLLRALQATELSTADRYRLGLLYNGTAHSTKGLTSIEQLLDTEQLLGKEARKKEIARKGFGVASSSAREEAPAAASSPAQLEALLNQSSWGHEHADFAATRCRGEMPSSFIGLWPELSVLNHSCAPNAVAVLVGDRVVVRATRTIPKHGEVTVSHLQDRAFAPLSERRAALQGAYGYSCQCYRCKLEESQPAAVQEQLQSTWELISSAGWLARARATLTTKGAADVEELRAEVERCTTGLEAAMREAGVAEEVQTWLKASAFGAYELLALCRDAEHASDPQHPASLAGLVALIAPGSEGHLFLAIERLLRSAHVGRESPETEAAAKECIMAHQIRYGMVSNAVLTQLVDANSSVEHYMGRYSYGGAKSRPLGKGLSASSLAAASLPAQDVGAATPQE